MENIHIGSIIRQKLKERNMRVIRFADALHCSRSTAYALFKHRNIDMELLTSVSKILEYDLSALYREDKNRSIDYVIVIETNELKMNELKSDHRIKIVKAWKMFENPDIL